MSMGIYIIQCCNLKWVSSFSELILDHALFVLLIATILLSNNKSSQPSHGGLEVEVWTDYSLHSA